MKRAYVLPWALLLAACAGRENDAEYPANEVLVADAQLGDELFGLAP